MSPRTSQLLIIHEDWLPRIKIIPSLDEFIIKMLQQEIVAVLTFLFKINCINSNAKTFYYTE